MARRSASRRTRTSRRRSCATAGWGYLRLRRPDYGEAELQAWADRVRAQAWDEAYVFFKHEDAGTGPRLAAQMLSRLAPAP